MNIKQQTDLLRLFILFLFTIWYYPGYGQSGSEASEKLLYGNYALKTYTIADGLPSKNTTATFKDKRGFIWVGTENGLCRFDGYNFKNFSHNAGDPRSISNNFINTITEDQRGRLWIGTMDGLNVMDPMTEQFRCFYHNERQRSSLSNNKIWSLLCDRDGLIWVGTDDGFNRFNESTSSFTVYQSGLKLRNGMVGKSVNAIVEDKQGRLWLGNWSGGLNRFDKRTQQFKNFRQPTSPGLKNPNDIWSLAYDQNDILWIGTYWNGLFSFNPETSRFTEISSAGNIGVYSILPVSNNTLLVGGNRGFFWLDTRIRQWEALKDLASYPFGGAFRDGDGILWVNGKNGLLKIDNKQYRFDLKHFDVDHAEVKSVVSRGAILWIGTNKGLYLFDEKSGKLSRFKSNEANHGLKSDDINKLYFDSKGILWVLTENGFDSYDPRRKVFSHYAHHSALGSQVNEDVFRDILEAEPGIYYLATDAGLKIYNSHNGSFKHYHSGKGDKYALSNNHLYALLKDHKGDIWLGTYGGGLNRFDIKTQRFQVFRSRVSKKGEISNNIIRGLYQDAAHNIWISTQDGLNKFVFKDQDFISYSKKDGFSSNVFKDIRQDLKGDLWVTTEKGISKFDLKTKAIRNFDETDGLTVNSVLLNAGKDLYLVGTEGLIKFDPLAVHGNSTIPPVYITDFQLFNKSVVPGNTGPLKHNLNMTTELNLNYDQRVFSFDFVGLNYRLSEKNEYAYQLVGFDKKWNFVGTQRKAIYTNLNPGTYKLWIRASNNDGVWNNSGRTLMIHISPPWYGTWWAYLLYILMFALLVYTYIVYRNNQQDLKYKIKVASLEREKENELHEKRLSFFTNISHEFRTPLTLIINPVKELLYRDDKGVDTSNLNIVYRNAKRLLSLVDQLLLFRKADAQADKLKAENLDIVELCKEVYLCFSHQVQSRNIQCEFVTVQESILLYADREKLEIAVFNLLSNAIKFTGDYGKVRLEIFETSDHVEIRIADTGCGIAQDAGEKIYTRFYQEPDHNNQLKTGFGIGLFLVRSFIENHGGSIRYESVPSEGTTFFITLLKGEAHINADQVIPFAESSSVLLLELAGNEGHSVLDEEKTNVEQDHEALTSEKKSILIIEDNQSIRDYLVGILKPLYQLHAVSSGEEGMRMIKELLPDFIISDVMMPGMSGIEVCRLVKDDPALCHIPIVLLTASASPEIKLKGLEIGADDYISKPFDRDLLIARVAGILKSKDSLQKYFYNEITLNPNHSKISAEYSDFLKDCIRIVDQHITDPDFSIQVLADEIGMSRSNLFKKIKSISGRSSNSFIRFIRLRKAAEIFINTSNTISETMYMVGINDVKYFREQFHKLFGMNPSDYIRKYRKNFSNSHTLNKGMIKGALCFLMLCNFTLSKAQHPRIVQVEIDAAHPEQTIEGFGASDAWTCQYAGLWPEAQRNKMADLLFSTDVDEQGKPIGIGLNFWRFGIGAGSIEQAKASGIRDEWRRQASFLTLGGRYDENALTGQMWFMNAAKARGVKKFLGFVNSPHVNFTLNGKAYSTDGKCNLDFNKKNAFCLDLLRSIQIIKRNTGITLDYISPVNEPQWKWNDGGQEGCPYTNPEIVDVVRTLSPLLEKAGLQTKIQIAEAGQLDYLIDHKEADKNRQIAYFFGPESRGYVGNLANVDKSISGHSYFTTSPERKAILLRKSVAKEINQIKDLRFWMSEYCILGDSLMKGAGRDLGISPALFVAKLIHHDFTYAKASSWQWWLSISANDYKDGLVYIDKDKIDGQVYESKMLWALGNYSRFIPAGSRRLPVKMINADGLYVSSYSSPGKIITVVVNSLKTEVNLKISGLNKKQKQLQAYLTTADLNLAPAFLNRGSILIPGESIATILSAEITK